MKLRKYLKKIGISDCLRSIFLQIIIKKLKTNRIIFNSSFNENYNFNTKYLFEYFLKNINLNEYDIKFIINDKKLYKELVIKYGNFFINTNSLKNIKYILEAKTWITSTIDPPIIEIFKNKNRIIYHLGHGIPLKNIIMAEENISMLKKLNRKFRTKNFTHALSTSEFIEPVIKRAFQNSNLKIVIKGQPRNDKLNETNDNLLEKKQYFNNKKEKYILYSPTWRPYEDTKIFPFSDYSLENIENFLERRNITLYIRSHPYYNINFDKNILKSKKIKFLNSDIISDIMPYLDYFFLLITDYSSIYLDFMLLNKPILFIDYDFQKYQNKVGFSFDYYKNTPGPKVKKQREFLNEIERYIIDKNYYIRERILINQRMNKYKFNNCKLNYEYILELLKK